MKTVVVLSDTHRNLSPLMQIGRVLEECDYIIHLGDMAYDANEFLKCYPEKTFVVRGNNDFGGGVDEDILQIEGRTLFFCHGHKYGVRSGTGTLVATAKRKGCDIALYGHTHESEVKEEDGVLVINPGCMTKYTPKQTYCYLVIEKQKAVATIVELRDRVQGYPQKSV